MRKKFLWIYFVIFVLSISLFFQGCGKKESESAVKPKIPTDSFKAGVKVGFIADEYLMHSLPVYPGIIVKNFETQIVKKFSYGNGKENIGIKDFPFQGSPGENDSCIDIYFHPNGLFYIFDKRNRDIKILDSDYNLVKTVTPKNFNALEKNDSLDAPNNPHYFELRSDLTHENIYVKNVMNNYVRYNILENKFYEEEIKDFFIGETVLITPKDALYRDFNNILYDFKEKNKGFINYSFDFTKDNNMIIAFLTINSIQIFEFNPKNHSLKNLGEIKDFPSNKNEVKIFCGKSKYFVFLNNGYYRYYYRSELIIINNNDFNDIISKSVYINNWRLFSAYGDFIYTWDIVNSDRREAKFRIYRLGPK